MQSFKFPDYFLIITLITLEICYSYLFPDLNEPRGSCSFPDVLVSRNKWRDLSGKWILDVEQGLHVLRLKDRQPEGTIHYTESHSQEMSSTKLVIRCVQMTYHAETVNADVLQTNYVTYVTDDNWWEFITIIAIPTHTSIHLASLLIHRRSSFVLYDISVKWIITYAAQRNEGIIISYYHALINQITWNACFPCIAGKD